MIPIADRLVDLDETETNVRTLKVWFSKMLSESAQIREHVRAWTAPRQRHAQGVPLAQVLFERLPWADLARFFESHPHECLADPWSIICILDCLAAKMPRVVQRFADRHRHIIEPVVEMQQRLGQGITWREDEEYQYELADKMLDLTYEMIAVQLVMKEHFELAVWMMDRMVTTNIAGA